MSFGPNNAEEPCLKNPSQVADPPCPAPIATEVLTNDPPNGKEDHQVIDLNTAAIVDGGQTANDDFPEGGLRAWLVVFGSFCAMFMVFAIVDSTAAFQEYFISHQLRDYSPEQVGWIFSLYLFLVFFLGIFVGPVFDARGPRLLVAVGSLAVVLSMMLLSLCQEYWHFMLNYAVLGGLGGALLNTPAYASIGHFFNRRRGFATGLASTSGSIGGIVIPLMLRSLLPKLGFAWSARVLGFLLLVLAIPANLLITTRLPPVNDKSIALPDTTLFKKASFTLCAAGMFLMEWGTCIPLSYISSYVTSHGQDESTAFIILAFLNVGTFFGMWIPGLLADHLGRFNVIIVSLALCAISIFALWLQAGNSKSLIIAFVIFYGVASGSNLSLIPVCVSQLCRLDDYGRHLSTAYFIASFGTLTSVPIGGQLLTTTGGSYQGLIIFAGVSYTAALSCYIATRISAAGLSPWALF